MSLNTTLAFFANLENEKMGEKAQGKFIFDEEGGAKYILPDSGRFISREIHVIIINLIIELDSI